jgi:hypothetical protein
MKKRKSVLILLMMSVLVSCSHPSCIVTSQNTEDTINKTATIQSFIERLRIAYETRDWNFLNVTYHPNKMLNNGRTIIERNGVSEQVKSHNLRKLKYLFNNEEYIDCKFTDIEIQQHPKYPEIYGITYKQSLQTSHYSDVSNVFWLIEYTNENDPVIHVSILQPQKDKKFNINNYTIH